MNGADAWWYREQEWRLRSHAAATGPPQRSTHPTEESRRYRSWWEGSSCSLRDRLAVGVVGVRGGNISGGRERVKGSLKERGVDDVPGELKGTVVVSGGAK